MDKHIAYLLNNHYKLISMMSNKTLPIKSILLRDVEEIRKILNSKFNKKEIKNEAT